MTVKRFSRPNYYWYHPCFNNPHTLYYYYYYYYHHHHYYIHEDGVLGLSNTQRKTMTA
jgi:hypothetical protein